MNTPTTNQPWIQLPIWTWISFPATRHGGAGTLSFADGHAEIWHWREPRTIAISSSHGWSNLVLQPTHNNMDRDLSRFLAGAPERLPIP